MKTVTVAVLVLGTVAVLWFAAAPRKPDETRTCMVLLADIVNARVPSKTKVAGYEYMLDRGHEYQKWLLYSHSPIRLKNPELSTDGKDRELLGHVTDYVRLAFPREDVPNPLRASTATVDLGTARYHAWLLECSDGSYLLVERIGGRTE